MNVEGITWHALTLEPGEFAATKAFAIHVLGLEPEVDTDDWVMFRMPDGNLLDLFDPRSELFPPYGLNEMACGFRVDDIEVASNEIAAAGYELLGDIHHIDEMQHAFRHFRGPDGRVWGLNQQR